MVGRILALLAVLVWAGPVGAAATAEPDAPRRAREVESYLVGFPQRGLADLAPLLDAAPGRAPVEHHYIAGLYGQALVLAGRVDDARSFADRLESTPEAAADPGLAITAELIRANAQLWGGDAGTAGRLALAARERLKAAPDPFLDYWSAMIAGVAARSRGQYESSLETLEVARAQAELADNPNWRSNVHYQLAVLASDLKQPQRTLEESREAFRDASLARNVYGMVKAKLAESDALEKLGRATAELGALKEALSIANGAKSQPAEALALANLADLHLRRHDFRAAYEAARQSLELAKRLRDPSLLATDKVNMGLALMAMGRIEAGKRFADEGIEEYEKSGMTADIAEALREYGQFLEQAGEARGALAMFHREQKLREEISLAAHDKAVVELQGRYEAERRTREIELLNRDNELKSAELSNRQLKERVWWMLAFGFAASFVIVAVLYRKLHETNRLLAEKNRALEFQSSLDPLTALYNRRHFQEFINLEPNAADRRRINVKAPVQALLLIDLDHFKQINDRHGHAAGDAVLVGVSQRLRETLRENDMIVRWGGEEFLVFVRVADAGELDDIVLRILNGIAGRAIPFRGESIHLTVSIGYAQMPLPPHDFAPPWQRAIALVDMALYMAKVQGRNRACGIRALLAASEEGLAKAERDLEGAWRDGIVDMQVLRGMDPPRPPAERLPAVKEATGISH